MNLSEIAEQVRKQSVAIPEAQAGLVKSGQAVLEAVTKLQGDALKADDELRKQQLDRLPLTIQKVQLCLTGAQTMISQRVSASQAELVKLKDIVKNAETELATLTKSVRDQAQALAEALPATKTQIHGLMETRRTQLATDKTAQEAANASLFASLTDVKNEVERLATLANTAKDDETLKVKDYTDSLDKAYPELRKALEALTQGCSTNLQDYRDELVKTRDDVVKSQLTSLQGQTLTALDEKVAKPAQDGIDHLVQALNETEKRQKSQNDQEVSPFSKDVSDWKKHLTGPPQLRVLVKAGKQVLQKVGKLNVLGPLANTL